MLFVGTSIIHPSTEGVFLLCNILDLLIYRLEKIINEARQWTDFLPIRFITLNAVPEKVDWYKKIGFKEMGKNIDAVNTYMYIDLIKDSQYVKNYFEQQTADLLGY